MQTIKVETSQLSTYKIKKTSCKLGIATSLMSGSSSYELKKVGQTMDKTYRFKFFSDCDKNLTAKG